MRRVLWTAALAVLVGLLPACSRSPREARKEAPRKEVVTLPPRPALSVKPVAEKYPDGVLSVDGFLKHAREMVGKTVTVRGVVESVNICPPEKECCESVPHLVLGDDGSPSRKRLMVVVDPPDIFFRDVATRSTQTYTGVVGLWSPDGRLINLDGILVVKLAAPAPGSQASSAVTAAK
jgi:hypothetical protein